MNVKERQDILDKAECFFGERVAQNHKRNTENLISIDCFDVNPFLVNYVASFLTGDNDPTSIAKALVYPRVLGTSIATTFGNAIQSFCTTVLEGYGSMIPGVDIEFVDQTDNRKKYAQVKVGPNTINKDDIDTINGKLQDARNKARKDGLKLLQEDIVIAVMYGSNAQLNQWYKKLETNHKIFVGADFWYRLTGDQDFYSDLGDTFAKAAKGTDGTKLLDNIIQKLAEDVARARKNRIFP